MVLLKQSSRSVLQKSCSQKFPKINRKTPVLKYLFKQFASLRPAALLKTDSSTGAREFCEIFQDTYFVFDYRMSCKKDVLKNPAKFTAKFIQALFVRIVRIGLVWPAANLLMFCRIDSKSVFKVLSLSTDMQSSTDLY